jgi:di/tricarboxylate transporter
MKRTILDAIVWALFSAVGIVIRPFLPLPSGLPPGGFANSDNLLACAVGGVAWVVLRTIVRALTTTLTVQILRILITLALVPLAFTPIFILAMASASRLILIFPFFFAGVVWGIISDCKYIKTSKKVK